MMESSESLVRPALLKALTSVPAVDISCSGKTRLLNKHFFKQAKAQAMHNLVFDKAPFPVLGPAVDALRRHVLESDYHAVEGIAELRKGICDFHRRFDNITCDPNNVIVGSGSNELILLLMIIFNGDVLVAASSRTCYQAQAILSGHTPLIIESSEKDGYRITPEGLEKVIKEKPLSHNKLLILKNPCSSAGSYYTEQHLMDLTVVFRRHRIIVISDEIYTRLGYTDNVTSLAQYYPEGTILSSGLSKWANAGGWRIGYHIYPRVLSHLLSAMKTAASHSYSCAPAPMQYACAEVLQNLPMCDEYIRHTTRVMKAAGQFCVRELKSVGVRVADPISGYFIFPNFEIIRDALQKRGSQTCEDMCHLMLSELSLAVTPRESTKSKPTADLTVRLCFINFNGSGALAESCKHGLDVPLDDLFVKEFCSPVHSAIMILKNWVLLLQQDVKL